MPIPSDKHPVTLEEMRWSKWLGSGRMYVKCFFGILKGGFRPLKFPILYRDEPTIDDMSAAPCITNSTPTMG